MNAILASRINPAGATAIEFSRRYSSHSYAVGLPFRPAGATAIEYSRRTPAYLMPRFAVRPAGQSDLAPLTPPGPTSGALAGAVSTWNPVGGMLLGTLGSGVGVGGMEILPGNPSGTSYTGGAVESGAPTLDSGTDTSGKVPDVATSAANAGMSQADQTALFNTVASGLNTAGSTIAAIINSGNQQQIAQLQADTTRQIAAMNLQASQAQAAGNMSLAQQNAQRAAQFAQFQQAFLMRPTSNYGLYIVAGAVVLGIIGTFVYLGASTRRKNPSSIRNPSSYRIETRIHGLPWTQNVYPNEPTSKNSFESRKAAEQEIRALRALSDGGDPMWREAEYRVVRR